MYALSLSKEQAQVVREALEVYARLKHGQFDIALHDLFIDRFGEGEWNHDTKEVLCGELKRCIFPELYKNEFYAVGNKVYPESSVAWDIMQVLRHRLSWDKLKEEGKDKPDFMNVNYDKPMGFSGQPLPVMSREGE